MIMMRDTILFKIGGSVLENKNLLESTISQITPLHEESAVKRIVIIPGGGSYANLIREIYKIADIGDELAHWMAIYTLNFNGKRLSRLYPNFKLIEEINDILHSSRIICIFLPFRYLEKTDELPHNWNVTSDSIALFIAYKLGLKEVFLVKDIDGIMDSDNSLIKHASTKKLRELKIRKIPGIIDDNFSELKEQTKPLDPYSLELIDRYQISCTILNGEEKKLRISNYFQNVSVKDKIFTRITHG